MIENKLKVLEQENIGDDIREENRLEELNENFLLNELEFDDINQAIPDDLLSHHTDQ